MIMNVLSVCKDEYYCKKIVLRQSFQHKSANWESNLENESNIGKGKKLQSNVAQSTLFLVNLENLWKEADLQSDKIR